ncbi:DNA polymerase II [Dasania sp. GY-MA-18]|uniref:DNA polymerase n=1 Tax=Dasania phycosphaerae TaxID=2950436 RepID=A0A9J6RJQ5_9GAMM|nr:MULTISPECIES: DNA polymerase II [Dasania]MCR8922279.1 DNA polymerase II [Dasania sp. GY-MA-18]MCZ0864707.1 DNA polymerase II [Dasania phycosphaerae]MCZ0868435.1 DNA polymerase II [Dasania phycosphaerae]
MLKPWPNCYSKPGQLRNFELQPVVAVYFQQQRDMRAASDLLLANGYSPLECDIKPSDRFLMERFIRGGMAVRGQPQGNRFINPSVKACDYRPQLKCLSIDIETAMQGLSLYSISAYAMQGDSCLSETFMVSSEPVNEHVRHFPNELLLLKAFLAWLQDYDPDVIIGWNVVNFDCWFLAQLCEQYRIPFTLGRKGLGSEGEVPHWRLLDEEGGRRACSVAGRVIIDGIELLKAATYRFESFALNAVAKKVLGDAKLIQGQHRGDSITELFLHDKAALALYNVHDCKLVWDIFTRLNLIAFAIARTCSTGLPLDRIGGSVASFDFRYLPLLHRQGFVAPNGHLSDEVEASPGGFVMDSQPGLYQHVLVLDFKSLYPSIIRSFKIDPMGMAIGLHSELDQSQLVPGFKGAWFSKSPSILPDLIEELWQWRDQAKANNDLPLSQAIKIIMSSFYGVLGSGGCRFFDPRLATSITKRGHQIIQQTAEYIERQLLQGQRAKVIYGDTDSVFVWLQQAQSNEQAQAIGAELAQQLNRWWQQRLQKEYGVSSALEIEFETHFQKFLMPTMRGSEQGSKKRYAGVIERDGVKKVIFKGLENVRTDWTPLARQFQETVFSQVFFEQPYQQTLLNTVAQLQAGELDAQLVYRKRLRRKLKDYQRNIPPHVQAAQKAAAQGDDIRRGDWIEYLITLNGAEPVNYQQSRIDYQHYIDKQLAPAVDSILHCVNDSFANVTSQQLSIF